MTLFSLIAVLLIEQIRPLPYRAVVYGPLARLARFLEDRFNAGEHGHGVVAWFAGVGSLVLIAGGGYAAAHAVNPVLAWAWNVLLLYLTMGFRQFSHFFTDIQLALRMDDLPHARELLAQWRGFPADGMSSVDIARSSIREALIASHLHVFGVLACFLVLPGPCGAVLYRAAAFFAEQWKGRGESGSDAFGLFARRAFAAIDWLPARMTAAGFAVVGNFEAAVYHWKNRRAAEPGAPLGEGAEIVLAAGVGALGMNLGASGGNTVDPAEGGQPGTEEVDMDSMQSAVGLVWRALLLWLLLALLLALAGLSSA